METIEATTSNAAPRVLPVVPAPNCINLYIYWVDKLMQFGSFAGF